MSGHPVTMKVVLVSEDRDLYDVCRSVLRQLTIDGPILETPGSRHGKADLTIWDISPGAPIPERLAHRNRSPDLIVVSKASLAEVQKGTPVGGFGFLLKPIKRPVLTAFLSAAVNFWSGSAGEKDGEGNKDLRADRDELLQILFEANLRLQESDQDRTNFLARALHDFKTPLTALQGYAGMLLRQSSKPLEPDQVELLERMQHSISRLSKMSGAMFELTSRNNTERKLNLIRSNMDNCVQNATDQIMSTATEKGISLSIDLDPPETYVCMDPGAIEQVLVNLLENACKFTRRNGSIEINGRLGSWERLAQGISSNAKEGSPAYKIEVQDNGMGILPEHLESVFEEYTSYAGARDRSGGGLGLAICRMLVKEHKGAIWAQSDQQGTKISFVLPVQQEMVIRLAAGSTRVAAAASKGQ